jgi:diguanylate cyclase (GGDEF)-like protein
MKPLSGLQARFIVIVAVFLLLIMAALGVLLLRQSATQDEILVQSGNEIHEMVSGSLRSRGESTVSQAVDSLVNPVYYFDLDAIGRTARALLQQPNVRYVIVYDSDGNILHDGSADIPRFGQRMRDPLAYEAMAADGLHVQQGEGVLEVSSPIRLGQERLGGLRVGYSLDELRDAEIASSKRLGERLREINARHVAFMGGILGMLLLLAVVASLLVQRVFIRPIRSLALAAQDIERGNYETSIDDSRRNDEIGDLVRAFRRMGASIARHDRDTRRMAYTDPLTGLSNRLAFREALDACLTTLRGSARQMALLFADIDDFKRINDTLGHDAGDEALVAFAERIRVVAREHSGEAARVARLGGDEFVVMVQFESGDAREAAARLGARIVAEIGRPIGMQGRDVFLGTSIGITVFPDDAADSTTLMKNADIAMYQAKVAGKNCYRFYNRTMEQAVARRMRLEQDLHGAWGRGELGLVYQPVYSLADRSLVGAEALLRWHHPEHGQVAPAVFVDVAEQRGLIEEIGGEVLRRAIQDAAGWREGSSAAAPFVSVNVSPWQLRNYRLAELVAGALKTSTLPPECLHLELTETAVIGDEPRARGVLASLRELGVRVWLDDFGTGFSGLSHLRRMAVDGVKIDRSFIADVLDDPDDLALATAIIAMAHSLGMTVVAEGVEQEGQYALLRERGCDLAQGFWLGHPVDAAEFAALLRKSAARDERG